MNSSSYQRVFHRVHAEYKEMPAVRLTPAQVQRESARGRQARERRTAAGWVVNRERRNASIDSEPAAAIDRTKPQTSATVCRRVLEPLFGTASWLLRRPTQRLRPKLRTVPMRPARRSTDSGEPITEIVFPNGGVASITTVLSDGAMVEVSTLGALPS